MLIYIMLVGKSLEDTLNSLVAINVAVAGVADIVAVGVVLAGVAHARAVVARVAEAIAVRVLLVRVVVLRAVVVLVWDTWTKEFELCVQGK